MEKLLGEENVKRLIVSLKAPAKWRIMNPIEIAENLKILCDNFSQDEVARRFGISKKGTLWVYLRLVDLSDKVKDLVRARKIGQDASYRISLLKDPDEQGILADAVLDHNLNSSELKAIVQNLKKRNLELPIEECINLTLKARRKITEEHIVITRIEADTFRMLKERSHKDGLPIEEFLKKILSKSLPTLNFSSLRLVNTAVIMSLGKEDFRLLKDKASRTKVKLEKVIDVLVKRGLAA